MVSHCVGVMPGACFGTARHLNSCTARASLLCPQVQETERLQADEAAWAALPQQVSGGAFRSCRCTSRCPALQLSWSYCLSFLGTSWPCPAVLLALAKQPARLGHAGRVSHVSLLDQSLENEVRPATPLPLTGPAGP